MVVLCRLRFRAFLEMRALHSWRSFFFSNGMAWRLWVGWGYIGHAYAHKRLLNARRLGEIGWSFLMKDERWR